MTGTPQAYRWTDARGHEQRGIIARTPDGDSVDLDPCCCGGPILMLLSFSRQPAWAPSEAALIPLPIRTD